jgi:hypothetical protein
MRAVDAFEKKKAEQPIEIADFQPILLSRHALFSYEISKGTDWSLFRSCSVLTTRSAMLKTRQGWVFIW